MEPSLAMNSDNYCFPITDIDAIGDVIKDPPKWVNQIVPLIERSTCVVENTLSDCHFEADHFQVKKRLDSRTVPRTLVCHDYKGGYREDRFMYDERTLAKGNSYTFYNWSQIDIFVYFSHHFITIPPVCWINAGHSNGVKVLGTIITEFKEGEEKCKSIFKDMQTMQSFARSLAILTNTFKFDGWLLNIENPVEHIDILKTFVTILTELTHSENPGSLVIWYDSVTIGGKLLWQNELNSNNETFFDSCDGIFLNYVWTEEKIIKSAERAKHRCPDVYVGIDVFGRNTFGGGNFNCYKAAEIIRKYNMSMAIFAPGWTHETLQSEDDKFFEMFVNRDTAFWKSLAPYMYTRPVTNVFKTRFNIGLDKEHYNIFSQQSQLSSLGYPENTVHIPEFATIVPLKLSCDCIKTVVLNNYKSYVISTSNLPRNISYVHSLFSCDLKIKGNTLVYFVTKRMDHSQGGLSLVFLTSASERFKKIKLLSHNKLDCLKTMSLVEVNPSTETDLIKDIEHCYTELLEKFDCELRVYTFSTEPCDILEIGATVENGSSICLFAFGIQNESPNLLNYFFNDI